MPNKLAEKLVNEPHISFRFVFMFWVESLAGVANRRPYIGSIPKGATSGLFNGDGVGSGRVETTVEWTGSSMIASNRTGTDTAHVF